MKIVKVKITVKTWIPELSVFYTRPITIRVSVPDVNDPAVVVRGARSYISAHLPRVVELLEVQNLGEDKTSEIQRQA